MRLPFLFFTLLITSTSLFSQGVKKELTLEDAVLGYYKGLYPDNLYGLDWTSTNSLYRKEKRCPCSLSTYQKRNQKALP